MIEDYLQGTLDQLAERAKVLKGRIPTRRLPAVYRGLDQKSRDLTDETIDKIKRIQTAPEFQLPQNQPQRFRALSGAVQDIDFLETVAISALVRAGDDDHRLNSLLGRICDEIEFPLIPPVVTTLSDFSLYYHIYCNLNLMRVPLQESRFMLHLPDLYHELCHPLLHETNNPSVEPLRDAAVMALGEVLNYLDQELQKERRSRSSPYMEFVIQRWQNRWTDWIQELFCDLFAVYTLGPAMAWSHFHLVAKSGRDTFNYSMEKHPSNSARMDGMLYALRLAGFTDEATRIRAHWLELLKTIGSEPDGVHGRCYPQHLLNRIAECALKGVQGIKCRIARRDTTGEVHELLNEAWERFWSAPSDYVEWERQAVERLFNESADA
ncbi:MAG: hypothetical protein OXI72_07780 [Gemmatimonadota bacterium]|nr:hypothetical protein [Gemmatimonadota bacterium]